MTDKSGETILTVTASSDRTDLAPNRPPDALSGRLREAVHLAGGLLRAARASGVPSRSISRFLAGQDVKSVDLVALADAAGVTVEWLATGRGPMRAGSPSPSAPAQPPAQAPAPAPEHIPSFTPINVDRLAEAVRRAARLYQERDRVPSPRTYAQILLLLCDEIAAAEKSREPS